MPKLRVHNFSVSSMVTARDPIMLWPPLHVVGLIVGGEVVEMIGAVLRHPLEEPSVG